jgi:cytochrome c-type biogenesis protein
VYEIFNWITNVVASPLTEVAYSSNIALLSVMFLGFVGSVAPCQISANIGAMMYFSNRQVQRRLSWIEISMYLLGKISVFSILGAVFWLFGQSVSQDMIPFFVFARKMLGPLLIIMGLFFLGLLKLPGSFGFQLSSYLKNLSGRIGGKWGAFVLGASFSFGFCPTMVWLFFGLVMPLVFQSSYGFILPPIFAIGTAMPFLLFVGLSIVLGFDTAMIKKSRQWGKWMQRVVGVLFLLLGVADTITYW